MLLQVMAPKLCHNLLAGVSKSGHLHAKRHTSLHGWRWVHGSDRGRASGYAVEPGIPTPNRPKVRGAMVQTGPRHLHIEDVDNSS